MDIKEIQGLIKFVAKSGASEVKLETDEIKITIRTGPAGYAPEPGTYIPPMPVYPQVPTAHTPPPSNVPVAADSVPAKTEAGEDPRFITIKSPIIGTFYRKPSPDKPPFVDVGDTISKGEVLCVIEAMKLFNDIESEVSGKVVKVLAEDSSPVEFDQPLFLIDPS
jgi:acetyl-CoA carboxylase biotin carboxyl carrier protein